MSSVASVPGEAFFPCGSAHGSVRLNAAATDVLGQHQPARLETALGPPSNKEGRGAIRTAVRPPGCFAVQILSTRCGWLSTNVLWRRWLACASDFVRPHVPASAVRPARGPDWLHEPGMAIDSRWRWIAIEYASTLRAAPNTPSACPAWSRTSSACPCDRRSSTASSAWSLPMDCRGSIGCCMMRRAGRTKRTGCI